MVRTIVREDREGGGGLELEVTVVRLQEESEHVGQTALLPHQPLVGPYVCRHTTVRTLTTHTTHDTHKIAHAPLSRQILRRALSASSWM